MIEVKEYNLPDLAISSSKKNSFTLWIPDKTYIVLGASNNAGESLITDNVVADNIAVLKRKSGGQSVVLTPDTLVISVYLVNPTFTQPKEIFFSINSIILKALNTIGIKNLAFKGISDIAINDTKILGSAIHKSGNNFFYHAVLNYNESPDTFERYLKHPKREPDYRKGRNHKSFTTSITKSGYQFSIHVIAETIKAAFVKEEYSVQ